ncbi:MAG TPA: hypothetical protein VKT75_01000 [Acidobacteriaceae bacterium]|nr:hypothetical protein [Acidobacteriaceae bacterium]
MLPLLLDENLSPEIGLQLTAKRPDIAVRSVHSWHGGAYRARRDELILAAAAQESLTLETYDQKTILPILVQWGQAGSDQAAVVFADDRTIAPNNYGALLAALSALWDACRGDAWTNRVDFLPNYRSAAASGGAGPLGSQLTGR